jgi:hypothetical protein
MTVPGRNWVYTYTTVLLAKAGPVHQTRGFAGNLGMPTEVSTNKMEVLNEKRGINAPFHVQHSECVIT